VGTERHESRRIDNQLRGRAGRQGDAGSSRFFLSAEDPLIRIFGGDRMKNIMTKLRIPDGEPIEAGIMTRQIEKAQLKVEARNFDIRKQLLEYDDVANDQRKAIYEQRNHLLEGESVTETVSGMIEGWVEDQVNLHVPPESVEEQWDLPALEAALADVSVPAPVTQWAKEANVDDVDIRDRCKKAALEVYAAKRQTAGEEAFGQFERNIVLQIMDTQWREHLSNLDHLRQGIHLRGYAQKNPKQEYKREAFEMFGQMLDRFRADIVRILLTVQIRTEADAQAAEVAPPVQNVSYQHAGVDAMTGEVQPDTDPSTADSPRQQPQVRQGPKLGRNDPCWCGSGKKYKHCHGALE
jgi:preprotein translocase subunit SecA